MWNELKDQKHLLETKQIEIENISALLQIYFPKELTSIIQGYYLY